MDDLAAWSIETSIRLLLSWSLLGALRRHMLRLCAQIFPLKLVSFMTSNLLELMLTALISYTILLLLIALTETVLRSKSILQSSCLRDRVDELVTFRVRIA